MFLETRHGAQGCEAPRQGLAEDVTASACSRAVQRSESRPDCCRVGFGSSIQFADGALVGGRYRIEALLGRGGMGEVYAARDAQLNRSIALKTVAAAAPRRADALRRLAGEARLAQRVRHPNVCHVHGWQLHRAPVGDRLPFLTMDLVRGESLRQRLRRQPLALKDIDAVARQLLEGLRAIHDAGVMHLDIKSANVMLGGEPGSEQAVIVDFGLSRSQQHAAAGQRNRPLSGTLAYMAPELLWGLAPSAQNDLFSFGVVLFEMLTRRLPYTADASTLASQLLERTSSPPPPPSRVRPGVPTRLDEVVLTCLSRPQQRYPDAGAALRALAA